MGRLFLSTEASTFTLHKRRDGPMPTPQRLVIQRRQDPVPPATPDIPTKDDDKYAGPIAIPIFIVVVILTIVYCKFYRKKRMQRKIDRILHENDPAVTIAPVPAWSPSSYAPSLHPSQTPSINELIDQDQAQIELQKLHLQPPPVIATSMGDIARPMAPPSDIASVSPYGSHLSPSTAAMSSPHGSRRSSLSPPAAYHGHVQEVILDDHSSLHPFNPHSGYRGATPVPESRPLPLLPHEMPPVLPPRVEPGSSGASSSSSFPSSNIPTSSGWSTNVDPKGPSSSSIHPMYNHDHDQGPSQSHSNNSSQELYIPPDFKAHHRYTGQDTEPSVPPPPYVQDLKAPSAPSSSNAP